MLEKAWIRQKDLELWLRKALEQRKAKRKEKAKDLDLPDVEDVEKLRTALFVIAILFLILPIVQAYTHCFDYENPCEDFTYVKCEYDRPWWAGLEVYGWFLSALLGGFGMLVDFIVFKRDGNSLIEF